MECCVRHKLLVAAWEGNHEVMEHSVDACILRLGQKIEDYPARPALIAARVFVECAGAVPQGPPRQRIRKWL